jgi:endonuclease YncB( thermonuclease family)
MDLDKARATFDSVDKFSFNGIEQDVKVVRVVDGDTVYVVADYNGRLVKLKCRLKSIDCAELKQGSLDTKGRDGFCGRDFLAHLCVGSNAKDFDENREREDKKDLERKLNGSQSLVYAQLGDFDCFGRVLVTLKKEKSSRKSFSQILKEYGYAKDTREKTRAMRQ